MSVEMKYVHTNIVARDWKRLSRFYQDVFGMKPIPPARDLSGAWLDALTGLENAHIEGEHLVMPGYEEGEGPTLEIFSYGKPRDSERHGINQFGIAHIAFSTNGVEEALRAVLRAGGSALGEMVTKEYPGGKRATFAYVRDIEGNLIELQSWE